jgi:glycosyltransferase involved in cell wall biosynthesis
MSKLRFYLNPSLIEYHSLIMQLIKIIQPLRVVEAGVFQGSLTEKILPYIESKNGELICIDLYTWNDEFKKIPLMSTNLKWMQDRLEKAIPTIQAADFYIFDEDHNYYSVITALEAAWKLNCVAEKPFFALVRGTGWPFTERDSYYNPDSIPQEYLHNYSWTNGIVPNHPGLVKNGYQIESLAFANEEGGDNNGVLPAIWKFLEHKREQLKYINVPGYFGLGFIYSTNAPWADEVTKLLKVHSTNPLLDQLEDVRLSLAVENCSLQYDIDIANIHHQNKSFNVDKFLTELSKGKGQRSGLGTVSIITTTLNRPELLKEAITCALNQTYRDIELLVVNDGGEDISSLIKSFNDKRIVYLHLTKNQGPSAARNYAIEKSTGTFIAYLDDDDLYYPDHIENLVNALHESKYHVAYCDVFRSSRRLENGKMVTYRRKRDFNVPLDKDSILVKIEVPPVAIMHRKSCYEKVGVFDSSLRRYEDMDLYIRLAQEYPFLIVTKPSVEYVKTDGFVQTITSWDGYFLDALLIIHERYHHLVAEKPLIKTKQLEVRNRHSHRAYYQLESFSNEQIVKIHPEIIMSRILENSAKLTREDFMGAGALLDYIHQRLPDNIEIAKLYSQFLQNEKMTYVLT